MKLEETPKEEGQNFFGMWGIKNRENPKKGENHTKPLKKDYNLSLRYH